MPECYIRGSTIKYLRIPDEVIDMVKEDVQMKSRGRGEMKGRGGQNQRGGRGGGRGDDYYFFFYLKNFTRRMNDSLKNLLITFFFMNILIFANGYMCCMKNINCNEFPKILTVMG